MRDWSGYKAQTVLHGQENGKRLVLEFAADYEKTMGTSLCISCTRSFPFQFNKFLNAIGMKTNKTPYILHPKYNGITLPGYRNNALSNYKMTEEKALHFIIHHKLGRKLFKSLPKDIDSRIETYEEKIEQEIAQAELQEESKKQKYSEIEPEKIIALEVEEKPKEELAADIASIPQESNSNSENTDKAFNVHHANKGKLIEYAEVNGIDLKGATTVNAIRPIVVRWVNDQKE